MRKLLTSILFSTLATLAFGGVEVKKKTVTPAVAAGHVLKAGDSMTGRLNITAAEFILDLENNTDAISNEVARFYSNPATNADGDDGFLSFRSNTSGGLEFEAIRQAWTVVDNDSKSKDSSWQISGFRGNVFGNFLLIDGETNRATFGGALLAPAYLFSDDPEGDSGIRGLADDVVNVFVGNIDRVIHTPTVSNFLNQIGIGAGSSFNPAFKVVTTTRSSHPCPSMTPTQRDAISTPEIGDCVTNTTTNNTEVFFAAAWRHFYRQLGIDVAIADGGTGQSTALASFDALAPSTTTGDVIAFNGTDNIRLAVGANTQVLTADSAEASGVKWAAPVTPTIVLIFAGGTDPHADTNSATYTTAGIFHFGGTTALGTPSKIKVIGFMDAAMTSWDFQVLDITNATTIVTKTGNTGTVAEIVDAGALSNLPAAEAMFEIQHKRTGGTGSSESHIYSASVEF